MRHHLSVYNEYMDNKNDAEQKNKTDPLTRTAEQKIAEKLVADTDISAKGRDMYEVCDSISSSHRKSRIRTGIVMSAGLILLLVIGLLDNRSTELPLIISAILIVATLVSLIMVVSVHGENGFIPGNKLKAAIAKQGYDADDVNGDFMQATCHYIVSGIIAVGEKYCVVYSATEFRISRTEDITKAEHSSVCLHISRNNETRHYIKIYERDNSCRSYHCTGKQSAELLLDRFGQLQIPVIPDKAS